jgi:heterotetrameric sarcosine oxidase gamma subunit
MSGLFLTPRPSAAAPARSPMLDAALAAGAVSEVRDGWEIPATFGDAAAEADACREAVGFADLSSLGKFELQGAIRPLDPGRAERLSDGWRCPVRPDREMVLWDPATTAECRGSLDSGSPRLCDLTASLAALVIAGPLARETFARFCALDLREDALPVGGFRPGSVARTPGFVLREAPQRYLLLCGSAYAEYMWETVSHAARGLGGRPVGEASLPTIETEATDA